MAQLDDASVLALSPKFRLQWEEAQNCYVLLYAEGMIKLNKSASEILTLVDGKRSLGAIIEELKSRFPGAPIESDVKEFIQVAHERGWVHVKEPS